MDYPHPTVGYSGSGFISRATTPSASSVLQGRGETNDVYQELPGSVLTDRGVGVRSLLRSGGYGLTGRRGSLDLLWVAPLPGTARTIMYLTDDPSAPVNVLAVRTDDHNRPFVTITDSGGTVVAEVTPTYGVESADATATLTFTGNASDGNTVTIGSRTYTFQDELVNADGNVHVGDTAADSVANLIAAINLGDGSGTAYAALMTANTEVSAAAGEGTIVVVQALDLGDASNSIAVSKSGDNLSWGEGVTSLSGGTFGTYGVGSIVRVQVRWDSLALIGSRHVSLVVKGAAVPDEDWSTDPLVSWDSFQPTHAVLGVGYDGDAGSSMSSIMLLQASNH